MTEDATPSICIFNCYPRQSRENFDRLDVGHPHDMYRGFLSRYVPHARVKTLFIADFETDLPGPDELALLDGIIWTGSDLTIYHDDDPRVTRQIELMQAIFEAGVPCYGSCWGIQMAAVAAGGEVNKNPRGREWGVSRIISQTDSGKNSLLLKGKPMQYKGFVMHLDEVTGLPPGATLLAGNGHTSVQALEVRHKKGIFWATQYHPEYNLFEMARLISARAQPLVNEGIFACTEDVQVYAGKMRTLYNNPGSAQLRHELDIGDDIINADIREQELRNWIDYLVLKAKR
jgi:GMP synthase (glutamine-hydrolysing)